MNSGKRPRLVEGTCSQNANEPLHSSNMSQIKEVCKLVEENNPPIEEFLIYLCVELDMRSQYASIQIKCDESAKRGDCNHEHHFDICKYNCPIAWKRLGQAIGQNESLKRLSVADSFNSNDMHPDTTRCIREFYNEVKQNRSLESLKLLLFSGDDPPKFNLEYFVRHNKQLTDLKIQSNDSDDPIVTEDRVMVADSLRHIISLRNLDISHLDFDYEDGTFERVVSACTGVEKLSLDCRDERDNFRYDDISDLLQNPDAMLSSLDLFHSNLVNEDILSVAASLDGNTKLKTLRLGVDRDETTGLNAFQSLLCDTASIQDIIDSNHTLENIDVYIEQTTNIVPLPEMVKHCLQLNKNSDKDKVIHQKIATYYFHGNFNMSPIIDMPISLLPRVIGMIGKSESNRLSAIYKLARNIPGFVLEKKNDENTANTYRTDRRKNHESTLLLTSI